MLTYCLKYKKKKNPENVDSKLLKAKNGRTMLIAKWAACYSKKSRFMKEQEAKEILSILGLKRQLSKIPLFSDILF